MRKLIPLFVILIGIFLVFNTAGMQLSAKRVEGEIDVTKDGRIIAGDLEFQNWTEYFRSDYFRTKGKRCLVRKAVNHRDPVLENMVLRSAADCTLSRTTIQGEYWPSTVYTIPVVFHVIYKKDGTGNISDQRILDQIEVLNEDYGKFGQGGQGFDTKIQFELVEITRTQNDTWFRDKRETQYKSALGWDQTRYLNIYSNTASGYLGYAYMPQDSAGEIWDGVVVLYQAVGGRDNGYAPYDQGRTLTHEVGHYLGLLHTFAGGCGEGYTAGDLIADTESESTAHYDCVQTTTCNTPDPIHNYMNYTDDLCMVEFTAEQANRLVCSLVNYRPDLTGGTPPPTGEFGVNNIAMSVARKGKNWKATATITILDSNGAPVSNATVYVTWSGIVSGTASAITGADGVVSINSSNTRNTGTFTVTVTDVTHGTGTYNPSLNVETSDSISN